MAMVSCHSIVSILLIMIILGIMFEPNHVSGCFVKDNDYGVELVIVKPGVTFNLSRLLEIWEYASLINYTFNDYSGEAVAYRSACNNHYAFVIGFIKINDTIYPVFTVKPLFKYNMGKEWWCTSFSTETYITKEVLIYSISSLDWKLTNEYHGNLYMTITPSPSEINVLRSIVIGVQDFYELRKEIGNITIYVSMATANATDEKHTGLIIEANDLNDEARNAVENLIYSLFNQYVELEWQQCSPSSSYNPSPEELENDLKHILKGELEFLIKINALKGISMNELEFIVQHIGPGSTGLNNTIVYDGVDVYRLADYISINKLEFSCRDGIVINESNVGYYTVLPIHPCIVLTATPISTTSPPMYIDTTYHEPSTQHEASTSPYTGSLSNIEALAIAFVMAISVAFISWLIINRHR